MNESFEKLNKYIKESQAIGRSNEEITSKLIESGWPEDQVRQAVRAVVAQQAYVTPASINTSAAPIAVTSSTISDTPEDTQPVRTFKEKYTVTQAYADSFKALMGSFWVITGGMLVAGAVYAAAYFGLFMIMGSISGMFGSLYLMLLFVSLIISALSYSIFFCITSLPFKNESDGAGTSFTELMQFGFTKFWRPLVMFVAVMFALAIPYYFLILSMFNTSDPSISYLMVGLTYLAYPILFLFFAMSPYIAIFESTPLYKAFGRSIALLKWGGVWFLVKFMIFWIILILVLSFASSQIFNGSGLLLTGLVFTVPFIGIVINIIMIYISVVINGVMVMLYQNRVDVLVAKAVE